MRVLLDTNVLLRTLAGDPAVESIRDILLADETEIFVSVVSWWDITARIEAGKLRADLKELREAAAESGFAELPLRGEHVAALPSLSGSGLKTASFDRMIAAQAEVEPLRLVSADLRVAGRSALFLRV
ncbi:MAG: type II toxin-antitoxin system VapC family toxin [Desulfovibrio sp.]|jgi:PIN domain nuclease of toxin-antitoxin system|nr:type II toxin-antitoxin system VapC family toxin [Desulfovibrio sp.]